MTCRPLPGSLNATVQLFKENGMSLLEADARKAERVFLSQYLAEQAVKAIRSHELPPEYAFIRAQTFLDASDLLLIGM